MREASRILAFDDRGLPHLPHWDSDRAAVLDDAAHVAPPGSEQGASSAIEDGVEVALCLRDNEEPAAALAAAFERRRRERAEAIVALGMGALPTTAKTPLRRLRDRLAEYRRRRVVTTGDRPWAFDRIAWDEPR